MSTSALFNNDTAVFSFKRRKDETGVGKRIHKIKSRQARMILDFILGQQQREHDTKSLHLDQLLDFIQFRHWESSSKCSVDQNVRQSKSFPSDEFTFPRRQQNHLQLKKTETNESYQKHHQQNWITKKVRNKGDISKPITLRV